MEMNLGTPLEVEGQDILALPGLALSNEEHPMANMSLLENKLRCFQPRQCSVEPGILPQHLFHMRLIPPRVYIYRRSTLITHRQANQILHSYSANSC